jgi:hypothetical protein
VCKDQRENIHIMDDKNVDIKFSVHDVFLDNLHQYLVTLLHIEINGNMLVT